MKKALILLIPLLIVVYFCGSKVISHVISITLDAIIGYYVLFILCQRILNKGIENGTFNNFDDMLKEYKIEGVIRVILKSFDDFGTYFGVERLEKYYRESIQFVKSNTLQNSEKQNSKPYIKDNSEEDNNIIANALIDLLEEVKKNNKPCKGISFKALVENNFNNTWGYFYHDKYISSRLCEIDKKCIEKNLYGLGILTVYTNGKLRCNNFDTTNQLDFLPKEITSNDKITDPKMQNFIKDSMINKIEEYKKIFPKTCKQDATNLENDKTIQKINKSNHKTDKKKEK